MTRLSRLFSLLSFVAVLFAASPSTAASWQTGNYGGNLTMTYYIPDNVDENPALVLALHYCSGNETSGQGWFKSFADQYGFMIISPKAPGNCWDASPGRSGDRAQIAQMIDWAIQSHNVDPTRVFSAGASSGACMSQTMLASYPDKIAAASALAGVPVGFWMGGNECGVCSQQVASGSAQFWGDKVRSAGPANYTGSRGRVQLFHAIQDQYLGSGNLAVEVAQWSNALDVTGQGVEEQDTPRSGWVRTSYENAEGTVVVQSNWWANSPANSHDLTSNINPPLWNEVVEFFGLDMEPPTGETTSEQTTSTSDTDTSQTGTETASTTDTAAMTDMPTTTGTTSTAEVTSSSTPTTTDTTSSVPTTTVATTSTTPTTTDTTSSAPTTTVATTSSAPRTTDTPPPVATTTTSSAPPTGGTAAPTGTDTSTDTTPSPVQAADGAGDAGCQCQLGATQRPLSAVASLFALGLTSLLRRRRRHS